MAPDCDTAAGISLRGQFSMQLLRVMTTLCPSRPQISIILLDPTARRSTLDDRVFAGFIEQAGPFVAGTQIACDLGNVQSFRLQFLHLLIAFFAGRVPLLPFTLIPLGTN